MVYTNGRIINSNVRYQDLCIDRFAISVAYNHDPWYFEIENNSIINLREKYGYLNGETVGSYSYIPTTDEQLSAFFTNYNVIINWIDCNFTWGWFDDETGKWTGAVGKVSSSSVCVCIEMNHLLD